MNCMDISIIIIIVILGFCVLGIPAFEYLIKTCNTNGQVSSTKFVDFLFFKENCVEYYGGEKNCFFATPKISKVKPNSVCEVRTHGLFLDYLNCEDRPELLEEK